MKVFRTIWSFINPIADIFGILGFFGISIKNINFNQISWYIYIALIFSSAILLKIMIKKIKDVKELYKDVKIKEDLKEIISQKNIQNIDKALPKTSTLARLSEKLQLNINNWADDAKIESFNCYIDYSNNSWEKPLLQVSAYSNWKNEKAYFYAGRLEKTSFEEISESYSGESISENDFFFKKNKDWKNIINKAFNSVSGKITNSCTTVIGSDSIRIQFYQGKIHKSKKFIVLDNFSKLVPN